MNQISPEVLGLSNEAVALARGQKIFYVNPAGIKLLGGDVSGQNLAAVFGAEVAGAQAISFAGTACVRGRNILLRVTRQEDVTVIFFNPAEEAPGLLNEAFIYGLRGSLMTFGMATDICRARAEELEDRELSGALAALGQSQYGLSRMVGNMTTVHQYLRNEMIFEPVELDIALFVRQYMDTLRSLRGDIEIICGGAERLYAAVDPNQTEQLISNLISNCLLHAKGCSRISVNVMDSGELAVLSVSDDGCGMDSDRLYSVFERYRHIYSMSEMNGGAGLGLTVVRGIAEKHEGTLLLESRAGHGTTVRVSFRKKPRGQVLLRNGEEHYGGEIKKLLLGLAGCLDNKYYMERYMD